MAKVHLLAVLCFLAALAGVAVDAAPSFIVQGRVYCDTCRAGFETTATRYMEGARVKLVCTHYDSGLADHTGENVTDSTGTYRIQISDNHDEEICNVVLVHSSDKGCSEIPDGRDRASIMISGLTGLSSNVRYANSLGFLKAVPLPECGLLLQKYALGVDF